MLISEANEAISKFQRERVIGEITVYLPEPPSDYKLIANWNLPVCEQRFPYTEQPTRGKEPDAFLAQEFGRFSNGFWFFNNGKLEWITGCNYFFLNYWSDKGKKLRFIDAQQLVFHWWWQIEQMDNIMGGNLVAGRRLGKTVIATCIAYFRSTTNPYHRCGIQSKTNKDGKVVFNKLVRSWRKLPGWLRPNHSGENRPATILEFSEPRTRSYKKGAVSEEEAALDSSIDYQASEEDAYDGEELNTVIEDETGKTITTNTDTRWGVLKYCLLDGTDIIGKAFRTSTVEDMEKRGGKNLWTTWVASMMKSFDEDTNQTESGLVNLLVTADWGLKGSHPITKKPFVDEYGVSDREMATAHILNTWKKLEGEKLKAAQRKMPLNIKNAFQVMSTTGTFDSEIYEYLDLQKEYLEGTSLTGDRAPKNLRRQVTFYRDIDGLAKWRDDPKGHSTIVWDFPEPRYSNARKIGDMNRYQPLNTEVFCGGCDPFAATIVSGPGSMGVLYIYRKGDADDPENSGIVIMRYSQRTRMVEDFHKNVMIICQYYGCKVNYETDVPDYYETFLREGFKNYVMWTPKIAIDPSRRNHTPRPGTLSKDPFAFQKQFQILVEYLYARWHKIYFIELINQLIEFDVNDRTKSDDVVAFCMAILAGWSSDSEKPKDTRTPEFIKFKESQRQIGFKPRFKRMAS